MPRKSLVEKKTVEREIVRGSAQSDSRSRRQHRAKGRGDRLDRIEQHLEESVRNCDYFYRGLFEPFANPGARFPQPACTGTDVSVLRDCTPTYTMRTGTTVTTDHFFAMVFSPNLKDSAWSTSGGASKSSVTWTSGDHPKMSSATGIWNSYRVTSLGIRLISVGKVLDRSGTLVVGTYTPGASSDTPPANLWDLLCTLDSVRVISAADLSDELQLFWQPVTLQSSIQAKPHGGTTHWYQSGLGMRAPDQPCVDNRLVVFYYGPSSATAPEFGLRVDRIMSAEFIPHSEDSFLFSAKRSVGSEFAMNNALMNLLSKASNNPMAKEALETGVVESAGAIAGLFGGKPAAQVGRSVTRMVMNALGGGAPSGSISGPPVHTGLVDSEERKSPAHTVTVPNSLSAAPVVV